MYKNNCMKTGHTKTDNDRYIGHAPNCCGIMTCEKCTEHRRKEYEEKFGWMNNEHGYSFFILEEISMLTKSDLVYAFALLMDRKAQIEKENPDLDWFRVSFGGKHLVLTVWTENAHLFKRYHSVSFDQWNREYVDLTTLDESGEEFLLVNMKNHKRIIGKGEKQKDGTTPQRYNQSVDNHSLRLKKTLRPMDEIKKEKIPEYKHTPIDHNLFSVNTEEKEKVEMDFPIFLQYRLTNSPFAISEWESYLGKFESKKMQGYLEYLYKNNPEYAFLSAIFEK